MGSERAKQFQLHWMNAENQETQSGGEGNAKFVYQKNRADHFGLCVAPVAHKLW